MALTSAATKEIARKERERLKAQDKYKKDQLEKLRAEQNTDASLGEVGYPLGPHCCASGAVQVVLCKQCCANGAVQMVLCVTPCIGCCRQKEQTIDWLSY